MRLSVFHTITLYLSILFGIKSKNLSFSDTFWNQIQKLLMRQQSRFGRSSDQRTRKKASDSNLIFVSLSILRIPYHIYIRRDGRLEVWPI